MRARLIGFLLGWVSVFVTAQVTTATDFHVTPLGTPQGQGTVAAPWDLATALAAIDKVKPGDTVLLHAGTYRGGFVATLKGKPELPVVVRAMPGERVTIDTAPRDARDNSLFAIQGADVVYRNFEVTCSHPLRQTQIAGSWPEDIHRGCLHVRADRISLVNLILHDLGTGVGFWSDGEGGEIVGCLIYNNGWNGPDRGHGHGIYTQNERGTKRIVDNVVFHQFGYGMQIYGSSKARLRGFDIIGNIAFENGCLTRKKERAPGIMLGGESPAERITVRDNVVVGGAIRLGYPWGTTNEDVVCTGNYCDNGLVVRDFRKAIITNNTVIASSTVVSLEGAGRLLLEGHRWADNAYFMTDGRWGECSIVEAGKSRGLTYIEWQKQTGLDAQSTFTKGAPAQLRVIIRPNSYEQGRAHVAILNPQSLPEVDVDLSAVLRPGQPFRVVSVKDFFGPPVATGTYHGQMVRIPMKPTKPPPPIGMPDATVPITEPQFAAFVVLADL
ncbi:MAG: hypothetical protein JWM11_6756 [Planctomycetaceae bacterium]|nr:hypothetical protein [Planctomycetaceae bacterium]